MENGFQNSVVEALILASPEPLAAGRIAEAMERTTPRKVAQAVAELNNRYLAAGAAFRIRELAGGYQFYILPEFTGYVEELYTRRRKTRLTRAALETLAIVAYRQPVTRVAIEYIRGVASDGVIHTLLEKGLIAIKGRAKTVGKPLQYGTTNEFLKYFGLSSLEDLPRMSEIEELISSQQPLPQTELKLEGAKTGEITGDKLNIADGTYNPKREVETDNLFAEQTTSEVTSNSNDTESSEDGNLQESDEVQSDIAVKIESARDSS